MINVLSSVVHYDSMQQTYPTTQSLHIPTDDLANTQTGYLSPNSISSDEACDSDSSDTSWPVISPVTSEDEYSATDSDSESSDEMLEVSGCDPVDDISMQSPFVHSPQDSQLAMKGQLPVSQIPARPIFRLCCDNIDKVVRQRFMRSDSTRPDSIHYFHSYTVRDRVDFTCLSEVVPRPITSTLHQHALNLLPSPADNRALYETSSF